MFQLLQPDEVPPSLRPAETKGLGKLPLTDLLPGQALRIPLAGVSAAAARKLHGALRTRAHRACASTGNAYRVSRADDCLYVVRVA